MITFACKKCGKRQRKAESQAGSLVFCDCGQSNRVPWEAAAEPGNEVAVPPRVVLEALPAAPTPPPSEVPLPTRRTNRLLGKVNPNFCFHHDEDASEANCVACKLPFCNRCVVRVQGQALCGPCKNFKLASLGRPRHSLPLAILAFVSSLASAPVALILSLAAAGIYQSEGVVAVPVALCVVAMALPLIGLGLSAVSLRRLDAQAQWAGRGLAASGVCVAMAGVVWCAAVAMLLIGRFAVG